MRLLRKTASALTPEAWLTELGYPPFGFQRLVLQDVPDRWILLLCARQSGKTHVAGSKVAHKKKQKAKSFSLILAPAQDQSLLVMRRVEELVRIDGSFPRYRNDNEYYKRWVDGGEVKALPGTERSARGSSAPDIIVFDEASRILDETYAATTPMTTAAGTQVLACTTAFGRRGWFFRGWNDPKSHWMKILVRIPWEPKNGKLIDAMPEPKFRAMWAERGIHAFYSTRHIKSEVQRELNENGEQWVRQEYCCEFLENAYSLFNVQQVLAAARFEQEPLWGEQAPLGSIVKVDGSLADAFRRR